MNTRNILSAIIIFVVVFLIYFSMVTFFYPNISSRGQFGDMFGALNAAFSGLAFLGVIYAILLQKEELSLQRRELELTRKELERTAKAQERSEIALSKQAASLKASARLNGLSALLQRYTTLRDNGIAKYGPGGVNSQWDFKAEEVMRQIERVIEDK